MALLMKNGPLFGPLLRTRYSPYIPVVPSQIFPQDTPLQAPSQISPQDPPSKPNLPPFYPLTYL